MVISGNGIVTLTGEQTLAHETAHTYDRAKGVDLSPLSPNGNWPAYEDRGMELEDEIREAFGEGGNRHGVYED